MEWGNPYNSFNSMKGLLFKDRFDGIISGKFLPPVEVNIDPVNNCNMNCIWCNGKDIINRKAKEVMTREHLFDLIDYCGKWGVHAICFAGGGEPTLHPDLADVFKRCRDNGLDSAIITNGYFPDERQIEQAAKYTRWIGVSVDAANRETFKALKKLDVFNVVIENMQKLVKNKAREVTFKFLIHPKNQEEIYGACRIAKETGCTGFHSRLISKRYLTPEDGNFDWDLIEEQIEACRAEETDNFKVYTISHKQDGKDNRRMNFRQCRAAPLLCMLEADGTVNLCIDRKGDKRIILCNHTDPEEIGRQWGSQMHKEILKTICPETDCPKCTMTIYQELLNAYEKDAFCWRFP